MPILKNPKHELFVQGIAKGLSGAKAYTSAGYTANANAANVAATRLLAQPIIQARRDELLAKRDALEIRAFEKAALSKSWVIERLMKNAMQALGEIPTPMKVVNKETGESVDTEVIDIDRQAANKALELLGKTLGQFIERKEIGEPGDFAGMSTDELREQLRREGEALGLWPPSAEDQRGSGKTRGELN